MFGNIDPLAATILLDRKTKNAFMTRVKDIRIHDFRHSCASLLIDSGANITLVAKYLGHSKIDETLNTYAHMFQNKLNNIISIIDNLNDNIKLDSKTNEFDNNHIDNKDYEEKLDEYDTDKDDFEISL